MASGKQCDKCATFAKHSTMNWVEILVRRWSGAWNTEAVLDLCPECARDFIQSIKTEEE